MEFETIVSKASKWNFEGDCLFLNWMQKISEDLETSASKTTEKLKALNRKVNQTCIELDNAANTLHYSLHYSQYVESRCLEDDELTIGEKSKTDEQLPTLDDNDYAKIFLQNNIKLMKEHGLLIDSDDSDDENGATFQQNDEYPMRLPHIIGSKLWNQHRHVGICDSSDDNSDSESIKRHSASQSSNEVGDDEDDDDVADLDDNVSYGSSDVSTPHWPKQLNAQPTIPDNFLGEQNVTIAAKKPIAQNDVPETTHNSSGFQDVTNIKNPENKNLDLPEDASCQGSSIKSNESVILKKKINLFDDNDFKHVDDIARNNLLDCQKDVVKQLKTGFNLFADLHESNDERDKASSKDTSQSFAKSLRNSKNFFFDDDEDEGTEATAQPKQKKFFTKSLFAEDDGNEDNLFRSTQQKSSEVLSKPKVNFFANNEDPSKNSQNSKDKTKVDLFGDNSKDLWSQPPTPQTQPDSDPRQPELLKKSLFVENDDNIFSSNTRTPVGVSKPQFDEVKETTEKPGQHNPRTLRKTNKSLFNEDDEDDDFGSLFGGTKAKMSKVTTIPNKSEEDSVASISKPISKSLFADDDDDDDDGDNNDFNDVFATKTANPRGTLNRKLSTESNNIEKEQLQKKTLEPLPPAMRTGFFNDDEDDQDVFPSTFLSSTQVPKKSDEKHNESEMFSENLEASSSIQDLSKIKHGNKDKILQGDLETERKPPQVLSKPPKSFQSLFGDEDDDDDDFNIFSAKSEKKKFNETSIFDEDGNPNVDSFSEAIEKSAALKTKEEPATKNSGKELPKDKNQEAGFFSESIEEKTVINPQMKNLQEDLKGDKSSLPNTKINEVSNELHPENNHNKPNSKQEIIEAAKTTFFSEDDDHLFAKEDITVTAKAVGVTKEQPDEKFRKNLFTSNEANSSIANISQFSEEKHFLERNDGLATKPIEKDFESLFSKSITKPTLPDMAVDEGHKAREPVDTFEQCTLETEEKSGTIGNFTPPSLTQNYDSLFFDEPPDDDAFFERLGSTSIIPVQPKSASSMWEEEDYEGGGDYAAQPFYRELSEDNANASNIYDVYLFSDIPPEDSGEQQQSKRLLDPKFGQTFEKHKESLDMTIETDPNDPDNELAFVSVNEIREPGHLKGPLLLSQNLYNERQAAFIEIKTQKEINTDTKMPELGVSKAAKPINAKNSMQPHEPKVKHLSETPTAKQSGEELPENKSYVPNAKKISKLKMPDLEINVQALLPSSGPRKSKEESYMASEQKNVEHPKITVKQESTTNDNLLSSLCKDRVRPPSMRRPSTRKGRQESLRQSQALQEMEDNMQSQTIVEGTIVGVPTHALAPSASTPLVGAIKEQVVAPTDTNATLPLSKSTSASTLPAGIAQEITFQTDRRATTKATASTAIPSLFSDDDADDDFVKVLTSKPKSKRKTMPAKSNRLFSDDEDDDDLFGDIAEKTENKVATMKDERLRFKESAKRENPSKGKAMTKSTIKTETKIVTDKNPLADLL